MTTTISAPARIRSSELAAGKHAFANVLKSAKNPIVLVGAGVAARHDGAAVLAATAKLALDVGAVKDGWNGFGILHDTASRVGALDIGFAPGAGGLTAAQMTTFGTLDVLFLLGADDIKVPDGTFVVYIGTHGDRGAHRADVILPGAAYTEKSGIYVNTEGRVQMANRASFPPGEAREDWAIIRALSDVLGKKLPYDSLAALRQAMFKARAASDAASTRSRPARPMTSRSSRARAAASRRRRSRPSRIFT